MLLCVNYKKKCFRNDASIELYETVSSILLMYCTDVRKTMFMKNILHPPKCVNHQQNLQPNLVYKGLSIVAVALFLCVI